MFGFLSDYNIIAVKPMLPGFSDFSPKQNGKLKPFETTVKLVKKACAGFGTNELFLTSCILRYKDLLAHGAVAYEKLFEKSIHECVKDETRGHYETLLLVLLNKAAPLE